VGVFAAARREISAQVEGERTSQRVFFGGATLLFAYSPAVTIAWRGSMSRMAMPGGWMMSMTWMRMPGQTWPGRRSVVPRHVDRDDGSDDVAIPGPMLW
jgi:hypothetical protein